MLTRAVAECRFRSIDPLNDINIIPTEYGAVKISDIAHISYRSNCAFCYLAISTGALTATLDELNDNCIAPYSTETDCTFAKGVSELSKAKVFEFFPKEPSPTYSI